MDAVDISERVAFDDDVDRCTVCGSQANDRYNGQFWCDSHLQQRLAREF